MLPIEIILEIAKRDHVVFNLLARALPYFGRLTIPVSPGTGDTPRDFRLLFKTYIDGDTKLCNDYHSFDDLPAIVTRCSNKYWCTYGKLHRDDDLPAVEMVNGYKSWYRNGVRHRDNNQPAIIVCSSIDPTLIIKREYYKDGIQYYPNRN